MSKIMLINNFRPVNFPSAEACEQKWFYLEKGIERILRSEKYEDSLEELFKTAENLHIAQYELVLPNFGNVIKNYLKEFLSNCLLPCDNALVTLITFWKKFRQDVITFKNIFLYFDCNTKNFKYNLVDSICFGHFQLIIFLNSEFQTKLVGEMLAEIELERYGFGIDQDLMKATIEMLNRIHIYEYFFQETFLKTTQVFYQRESTNLIQDYQIFQYMKHVSRRLHQERERIQNYLDKKTEPFLLKIVYRQFIEKHVDDILTKGFDDLLENNKYEELSLIYTLFEKIENGIASLVKYFQKYIISKGAFITNVQNDKNIIQELLEFRDNLENTISKAFDNKPKFHEIVRFAFKKVMNNTHIKSAHLLARYIDSKMCSSQYSSDDLDSVLSKLLNLFKQLQSKDVFLAFYKKLLAKRLLLGKSANQDAENNMISKLKNECGDQFTFNLEGMFQDMNISRSINLSFKQELNHQDSEFNVNVLTTSYWPSFSSYNVNLPYQLNIYQDRFQQYYLSKHAGRKLLWQSNLSYCLVKADFKKGCKELQISLFQAVILLLFNTNSKLLFKEIQDASGLEKNELERTIASLIGGKAKVLIKIPKKRQMKHDDYFLINEEFTDKLFRLKINQIQLQDTPEEDQETQDKVVADRQLQIDAAIVRIMKTSKTLEHHLLLHELYKLLDIPVLPVDIKKRIELLIEREYIKRDVSNKSIYIYIA